MPGAACLRRKRESGAGGSAGLPIGRLRKEEKWGLPIIPSKNQASGLALSLALLT
jgi:hypothetical protein